MKIEVQFDHGNQDWYFRPLDRSVRGRFLLSRVAEPTAMSFRGQIPEDVPAQIVGIDTETGTGYLLEPVHKLPAVKATIERRGMTLEPERQEFPVSEGAIVAWLFWMDAAVKAGTARVTAGELPKDIAYDPPSRLQPAPKRGDARLREIFRKDPSVAAQYMEWEPAQQKQWREMVGV